MGYALYDSDSNLYEKGKILLSSQAENKHEKLNHAFLIEKGGFMETFLVNETSQDVFFDNFRILSTPSTTVQVTHYYPFGMEMPALSYQAPAMNKNRYLYNQGTGEVTFDTERIPDLNIDLTKFRAYDPALGRWWQIDPMADALSSLTPYNYSFNNPVLFNDPLGDCPPGTNCEAVLKGVWNSAVAAVGFVKDTWNSGGKNVVNSVKNTYEFGQFAYNSPQTAKGILADGIKGEVSNRLEANNYDPIAAASEAVGEVLGGVALGALGDKGLSKLGTLGKVANVLDDVGDAAKGGINAVEQVAVHGNSLKSLKPTWGYKLYSQDGTFLKNGITSKLIPETRYTKAYMSDKYMEAIPFPNRLGAYKWEFQQNQILRGPLNLNMH